MPRSSTSAASSPYRTVSFPTESADRLARLVRYPKPRPNLSRIQYLSHVYEHLERAFRNADQNGLVREDRAALYAYVAKSMLHDRRLGSSVHDRLRPLVEQAFRTYTHTCTQRYRSERQRRNELRRWSVRDPTLYPPRTPGFMNMSDDDLRLAVRRCTGFPWNVHEHGVSFFLGLLEAEIQPYRMPIVAALGSTPLPNNLRRVVYRQLPNVLRVRSSRSPRT